jgi:hypothetical protein
LEVICGDTIDLSKTGGIKNFIQYEDFGVQMYHDRKTRAKMAARYPNVSKVVQLFVDHGRSKNYKFIFPISSTSTINRAIRTFNVELVKGLIGLIHGNNSKEIIFTSVMLVYLYENKYIKTIKVCKMPTAMYNLRSTRYSIVRQIASNYICKNIAQIIAEYVPEEISYIPTNLTPDHEKERLAVIGIDV